MRRLLTAALAVSFFAGCSSVPVAQAPDDTVDHQYVAAVEQAARRYGTYVVWVNLPQKRSTATQ